MKLCHRLLHSVITSNVSKYPMGGCGDGGGSGGGIIVLEIAHKKSSMPRFSCYRPTID